MKIEIIAHGKGKAIKRTIEAADHKEEVDVQGIGKGIAELIYTKGVDYVKLRKVR